MQGTSPQTLDQIIQLWTQKVIHLFVEFTNDFFLDDTSFIKITKGMHEKKRRKKKSNAFTIAQILGWVRIIWFGWNLGDKSKKTAKYYQK